eukprot:g16546.t1
MLRLQSNEKQTFSTTLKASAQETEAALRRRRSDMDQAWDDIDQGWKDLQQGMTEIGITKPSGASDGMVRLNVGGSPVNVRRSVLDGKPGRSSPSARTLGDLFQAQWDKRLPVDKDGRYVLDESPIVVKHLIHALLRESSAAEGARELPADEEPYLPFVACALDLMTSGVEISGGSTILGSAESGSSKAALQDWFPGETLELLYRATRDGWSPGTFRARCGNSSRTISLFQVGNSVDASVVGGFSTTAWGHDTHINEDFHSPSPGAFIFMLKDGSRRWLQPVKWGIKSGCESFAVFKSTGNGPCFGRESIASCDLGSCSFPSGTFRTLRTANHHYNIPAGSAILNLNGQTVSEIEVFRVSPSAKAASPPKAEVSTIDAKSEDSAVVTPIQGKDDLRNFGFLIADSLMEERMTLRDAEAELRRARAAVSATANALEAVYGPDIAAGKEDPVIELSVRGARVTTLSSTLQLCPDSALATRFDETKWPAHEKDVDEHGRRVVDCCPAVLSKVLDVLRG